MASNPQRDKVIQLVLDPPQETSREALLDELAARLDEWIRA